ncbi:hypothetical protein [Geoalkalibacter halelectricus]|uniref:MarR family transcriptional regulator n=1 Tax=Geoalkalibacter halelectricus TaxID=2847045 RepID=A0ABY5ZPZ4_9BACT|nr:hypothetical protein [Geoalkalibacter halelectricus]MDO3379144.1 hypothetical protein [Geoalkalibacter halelectricus]UWZ80904.1 hypothetical protein L9S41_05740 [Geoalkalibacter halelectricus]
MGSIWFDLEEIQTLSRIFLAVFVLIGLIPFFRKNFLRLFDYLNTLRRLRAPSIAPLVTQFEELNSDPSQLGDLEYIVFTHLAQTGPKGVSLAAMSETLHMDTRLVAEALKALNKRGLVALTPGFGLIKRFALSKKGRALALEKGQSPMLS